MAAAVLSSEGACVTGTLNVPLSTHCCIAYLCLYTPLATVRDRER